MKKVWFTVIFFCMYFLVACSGQPSGNAWTEVDVSTFDLEEASGSLEETNFDTSVFQFDLNADPVYIYQPKFWLDTDTVLCVKSKKATLEAESLVALSLNGEETVLDENLDKFIMVQGQKNSIAYAPCYETALEDGITFAAWNSETRALTPIYQFHDGYSLSFQQFFSPDASKAAFTWTPEIPAKNWKIRVVDMTTGKVQDLTPPLWDIDTESTVLFVRWLDDSTLLVTETDGLDRNADCIAWEHNLS